jgi:hypothetical protein
MLQSLYAEISQGRILIPFTHKGDCPDERWHTPRFIRMTGRTKEATMGIKPKFKVRTSFCTSELNWSHILPLLVLSDHSLFDLSALYILIAGMPIQYAIPTNRENSSWKLLLHASLYIFAAIVGVFLVDGGVSRENSNGLLGVSTPITKRPPHCLERGVEGNMKLRRYPPCSEVED